MNENSKRALAFLLGAAAGVAIGYFLASDHKDEIISDLKDFAGSVKDHLNEEIEKGTKLAGEVRNHVGDLLHNA